MKKIVSLLMAVVMIFTVFMPASASIEIEPSDMTSSAVASLYPEVFDTIIKGVENCESSIDLGKFQLLENELITIYKSVVFENPQLFYINPYVVDYTTYVATDFVYSLRPTYLFEIEEIPEKQQEFDKAVEFYLKDVDSSWSNFRKCRYIHDLMATTIKYDTQYSDDKPLIYSAYGALVNNLAVCQGYTLGYNYLMQKLNIKAFFIENTDYDHSWSMVKLGNYYYHVDIVWDDPSDDLLGRVMHNLCLVSDSRMKKERPEVEWYADHKATSTTFDNSWWNDVETMIYTIEGKDYYIEHLYTTDRYGALMRYDPTTKTEEVIYKIKDRWYADDSKTHYWARNYSSLSYDGEMLYFSTPDSIYFIKPDGSNMKQFFSKPSSVENNIYGMATQTDGEMYVQYQKIPDITGSIVKLSFPEGDVNLNGVCNITDVTKLQKYLVRKTTLTLKQKQKADHNGDGKININDATSLQRKLVGL